MLAAVLLVPYGLAAYETARDDRAAARARKAWPAQKAQLEQALRGFVAPADWVITPCSPAAAAPVTSDGSLSLTHQCWLGARDVPASYQQDALAALTAAGATATTWTCDTAVSRPMRERPRCQAAGAVGGRQLFVFISPRLDRAASRDRRQPFVGVDISLIANTEPPY